MPRPENILGRVDVGMVRVVADHAPKRGLIRPVLRRHMTTSGASLAHVPGIDSDQTASPPRQLGLQQGEERSPSLGQKGLPRDWIKGGSVL